MRTIMKYEFKKIFGRKISIIAILLLMALSVLTPFISTIGMSYTTSYDATTDRTNGVKNLTAVSHLRKAYHAQSGDLTTERFAQIIEKNRTLKSDPNNVNSIESVDTDDNVTTHSYLKNALYLQVQDNMEIENQLRIAFSPNGGYDYGILDKLTTEDASKFYQKRTNLLTAKLNEENLAGNYTQKEKDILLEMNAKIETPFYYDYSAGWTTLITNVVGGFTVIITFVCLICLAPLFAGEYQTGADSILLTTKKGREKLAKTKVQTGFLFTTTIYFMFMAIEFIVTMLLYGGYGFNCPIQLEKFFSVYNFNMLETYLMCVLLGYFATLSIVAIVMMISARYKTAFTTIIVGLAIFVFPLFIPEIATSRLINYLVALFPIRIMNSGITADPFLLFNFFGNYIQPIPVYIVLLLACIIICIPFAISGYKKHQVA